MIYWFITATNWLKQFSHISQPSSINIQEGLAVASIVWDDISTLPGNDPSPRARMHRDCNAWQIWIGILNLN